MEDSVLIAKATEMLERAYVPYSNYRVGAALLGKNGRVYGGCNFENASYGATICAERCAVAVAVADGCREFSKIAIISSGEAVASPCGICRQVLFEFSDDLTVICASPSGETRTYNIKELLLDGFR